jgi:hypothetical protein
LDRLASLVEPRGLVVLISPYSWLPGYTSRDNWMGQACLLPACRAASPLSAGSSFAGGKLEDGKPVYTKRSLLDLMEPEFEVRASVVLACACFETHEVSAFSACP